ncbi:hypothetical protein ACIP5N_33325 [Streptomyces sp. NPDC088768]|uniref:hypothetical protein n=1 Tax=Streptomyces sp. NPDC088768 TaxID=3365894 RepID=UPI00382A260B
MPGTLRCTQRAGHLRLSVMHRALMGPAPSAYRASVRRSLAGPELDPGPYGVFLEWDTAREVPVGTRTVRLCRMSPHCVLPHQYVDVHSVCVQDAGRARG